MSAYHTPHPGYPAAAVAHSYGGYGPQPQQMGHVQITPPIWLSRALIVEVRSVCMALRGDGAAVHARSARARPAYALCCCCCCCCCFAMSTPVILPPVGRPKVATTSEESSGEPISRAVRLLCGWRLSRPLTRPIFTDFPRFFGLSRETSTFKNYHPEDSRRSGSGRIEFSSKSTTFCQLS